MISELLKEISRAAFKLVTMYENFSAKKHHPKITGVLKREHIISENSRATYGFPKNLEKSRGLLGENFRNF